MIFNVTGGGGTSLNFKVVGGLTAPENPKENTIWAKTDIAIPEYAFSELNPPAYEAKAGTVSIYYTSSEESGGDATISFVKKNKIWGELGGLYQNQDGTASGWKRMNAYIYKSGSWVQFSSEFAATIAVTYPEGSTCTCTNGTTTLTATTTTGSYSFVVPNTGTWTLSCTDGDQTATDTVEITADGQSESVELTYFDGYLFNYGSVNEGTTGGWEAKAVPHTAGYGNKPTVTAQSDGSIELTMSGDTSGIYVTKNKIDLSKYSTLTFVGYTRDYHGYRRAKLQVMSDIGTLSSENVAASFYQQSDTVLTYQIDISGLTGNYYIAANIIFDAKVKLCSLKLS